MNIEVHAQISLNVVEKISKIFISLKSSKKPLNSRNLPLITYKVKNYFSVWGSDQGAWRYSRSVGLFSVSNYCEKSHKNSNYRQKCRYLLKTWSMRAVTSFSRIRSIAPGSRIRCPQRNCSGVLPRNRPAAAGYALTVRCWLR